MLFTRQTLASPSPITDVNARYLTDEQALVNELRNIADPGESMRARIRDTAAELVAAVRRNKAREGGIDAFLQQYDLSSEEGVLLMCIAEALLRIPEGAVLTYSDLADRVGAPGSARAVAGAVARNPVSWLIPCHRVIRSGGSISGYRWQPEKKRLILAWEAARAEADSAAHGP